MLGKREAQLTAGVLFLCLVIGLQILGAPIAFYDLNGSTTLVESALLEGLTLTADRVDLMLDSVWRGVLSAPSSWKGYFSDSSILRPPILTR